SYAQRLHAFLLHCAGQPPAALEVFGGASALAGALEDAAQPLSLGRKPPANLMALVTAMEAILDDGVDPKTIA
ncbi:MAG: hypothetical protein ACPGVX_06065, partial [Thalassobaculaceae bacterium]